MLKSKEQKEKEEIKTALKESDFIKLLRLGLAKFMELVCGDGPIPFQKFLEYSGEYFDHCILEIAQKRHLNYVGGKMIMELKRSKMDIPGLRTESFNRLRRG